MLRCRFRTAWSVHNTLIKYLRERERERLAHPDTMAMTAQEKVWREADEAQFGKAKTPEQREARKNRIAALRNATDFKERKASIDKNLGLTRSALSAWATEYFGGTPSRAEKYYGPHTIGAQIIQSIAQTVWTSYETYRFPKGGRKVGMPGYARLREFSSVSGMSGYGNVVGGPMRWDATDEVLLWSNGQQGARKREIRLSTCALEGDRVRDYVRMLSIPDDGYVRSYGSLGPIARVTRNVQQVRIVRRQIRSKVRYYAQIVYAGALFPKLDQPAFLARLRARIPGLLADRSEGVVGVDVGTQHIGAVSENVAFLAPLVATFERGSVTHKKSVVKRHIAIKSLSRFSDRSFRATYPERFNPDGTVATNTKWDDAHQVPKRELEKRERRERDLVRKRKQRMLRRKKRDRKNAKLVGGKRPNRSVSSEDPNEKRAPVSRLPKRDRSRESRAYRAARRKIADLKRAEARTRAVENRTLVNVICAAVGRNIATEILAIKGWQKAFGKSVALFSPGAFLTRLKEVARRYGGVVTEVPTKAKLSQLCPACGGETKTPIRGKVADRMSKCAYCDREPIQRDLLASFCARFATSEGTVDVEALRHAWKSGASFLAGPITVHGAQVEIDANAVAFCDGGLARMGSARPVDTAPKSPVSVLATPSDGRERPNLGTCTPSSGAAANAVRSGARNLVTTAKKERRRVQRQAYRDARTAASLTRSKNWNETT